MEREGGEESSRCPKDKTGSPIGLLTKVNTKDGGRSGPPSS